MNCRSGGSNEKVQVRLLSMMLNFVLTVAKTKCICTACFPSFFSAFSNYSIYMYMYVYIFIYGPFGFRYETYKTFFVFIFRLFFTFSYVQQPIRLAFNFFFFKDPWLACVVGACGACIRAHLHSLCFSLFALPHRLFFNFTGVVYSFFFCLNGLKMAVPIR